VTLPPVSTSSSLASQALKGGPVVPPKESDPRRREPLNLSRQPFINTRPVRRVALFLWVGGVLLLGLNVALFWSYLGRSETTRTSLAAAEAGTVRQREAAKTVESRLSTLNLDRQNRQVTYLNRKIAERVFAWSVLFDRMAEVLPDGVRLVHLSPTGLGGKEQQGLTGPLRPARNNEVVLDMTGEAKSNEAIFLFVDRLFAHSSFSEPKLNRTDADEDGFIRFEIKVNYLPDVPLQKNTIAKATPSLPSITRGVARPAPRGKP
jgi:Tfp pilus assembly protein PilN